MPYRKTPDATLCAVCEALTTRTCRLCNRSLCADHANAQPFFGVESVECLDQDQCFKPRRRRQRGGGAPRPARHYVLGHDKLGS